MKKMKMFCGGCNELTTPELVGEEYMCMICGTKTRNPEWVESSEEV